MIDIFLGFFSLTVWVIAIVRMLYSIICGVKELKALLNKHSDGGNQK